MTVSAFDIARSSAQALRTSLPRRRVLGELTEGRHLEVFHAIGSPCSQKVLAVLAALGLPYEGVPMSLSQGDTYLPPYVRMRLAACDMLGIPLQTSHAGSTSVEQCGADAAVVPTLIDWETDRVIVDSRQICVYLDERCGSPLRPAPLRAAIDMHLRRIDQLPNYQIFVSQGLRRAGAASPFRTGADVAMAKVARCDRHISECAPDDPVVRGYIAKRAKEMSAARTLFSDAAIQQAYMTLGQGLDELEVTLRGSSTVWLHADRPLLADLVWGVELMRLHGLDPILLGTEGKRPHIAAYRQRLEQLSAIQSALMDMTTPG